MEITIIVSLLFILALLIIFTISNKKVPKKKSKNKKDKTNKSSIDKTKIKAVDKSKIKTTENKFTEKDISHYVYGELENPDIVIKKIKKSDLKGYKSLELSPKVKTGIQSLLTQIPNLGFNLAHLSNNTYQIVFSASTMAGLQNGQLALMNTVNGGAKAIATQGGKTFEIGNVVSNPGVNPVALSLIVWQGLAIITAQKYLVDINRKLKNIEKGVNDIKDFLENERLSRIIGKVKYLSEVSEHLNSKELTESDVNTLNIKIEDI